MKFRGSNFHQSVRNVGGGSGVGLVVAGVQSALADDVVNAVVLGVFGFVFLVAYVVDSVVDDFIDTG